jgi:hypothetical protein
LRADFLGTEARVSINGADALVSTETKGPPSARHIVLFLDIGSEAFFSNFVMTPR